MQVLAHNILSQFTNTQLNMTLKNKNKITEKMSTGFRINRSADDAAGLTISEKMRWQIRGLNKGTDNITNGISLIETADGALAEVHSILQRVRELTIQAYNDTNTEADRNAIQSEIDNALEEVERIAETTTFNTQRILRGNPLETVKITEDKMVDKITTMVVDKELPSWMSVDSQFTVHSGYTQQQDISGGMQLYDGINEDTKQYYGLEENCPEGYTYMGEWTSTISDNASAKIDFRGLTNSSNGIDLYSKLYELIGSKISFPCGTCSTQVSSISFGGSEEFLTTTNFANSASIDMKGNVNLSTTKFTYNGKDYNGYFDAVEDVLNTYAVNYDEDDKNDLIGEGDAVVDIARAIASDLRDKTYEALSGVMTDHFDRVVQGSDNYSLIVYDYRDSIALSSLDAADTSINTDSLVTYRLRSSVLQEGLTVDVENPIRIMCGATSINYLEIDLPVLSLDALLLSGYRVDRYRKQEVYSESYKDKMIAWENSARNETHERTRTVRVIESQKAPVWGTKFENGETKMIIVDPGSITVSEKTITERYTTKVYGPKPEAEPGDITVKATYIPDAVDRVDFAIAQVSSARSKLGAVENRLHHAYNINTNTEENTQSAESRIRDLDMAKATVDFSKNTILEQAAQAMLAQSNQNPLGILTLLQ